MNARNQHGMALTEAALALMVALPLVLVGISAASFMHDLGVVTPLPGAVLQEQGEPAMVWRPDGDSGAINVSHATLQSLVATLTRRGVESLQSQAVALNRASAVACYWVYRVDGDSGAIGLPLSRYCTSHGDAAAQLSLDAVLSERLARLRGLPQSLLQESAGYADKVVLIGVAVGGEFNGLASLFNSKVLASGAVELPRREVSL